MAKAGDLWHNDAYFTPASHDALDAQTLGENVAMNADVDDMHRRLMASPHHRDNILDGRFSQLGVGVAVGKDGVLFATEDFVQPRVARTATVKTAVAKPTARPHAVLASAPSPAVVLAGAPAVEPSALAADAVMALPSMPLTHRPIRSRRSVPVPAWVALFLVCALGAGVWKQARQ
jgi:hypothetical protein